MRIKHKTKLKMARKMMDQNEIRNHIPPFLCKKWIERAEERKKAFRK